MQAQELRARTKKFALDIVRLVESLPRTRVASILGVQLLRSGTSVGANYRAACRGRTPAEFVSKIGIVIEEADESLYWLELLAESGAVKPEMVADLMKEANELVAIFTASSKTVRNRARQGR
jgi:four helix bundle protein